MKKIVVAYSGGLDTSVLLNWLKDVYDAEIIAYCADIGQGEELDGLEDKALATGASKCIVDDLLAPQWLVLADTPHLDALAARAAVFQHAYCNSPICAPSRASMCTGRLVSNIGAYDNGADFPANTPTFMSSLADNGYEVWLSGKMHFIGPDQHRGFQRRLTTDIYPSAHVWTPDWNESPVANPGTAVDQLSNAGLCTWNLQLDYDEETQFRALEAMRELARHQQDSKDRPFFLCASFTQPHEPFITTREWWDRYDHDDVPLPEAPAESIADMHPYNQWLQIHHMVDKYPPREEDVRNARHAYLGMISYFDQKVGELLTELDRLGIADETIVMVTSDHGEMLGEHGMWFKRTFFEPSVRVPLLFAGPGIESGEYPAEVSLLDLFPTLLDLSGTESTTPVDGHSLAPILNGDRDGKRDAILIEYLSEGVCQPLRAAVRDRIKYVHVQGEEEQLFDLNADPLEQINRIDDPAYTDQCDALRSQVLHDYDPDSLRNEILASQQRRRQFHAANPYPGWDVAPDFDPADQYVRKKNAQATNEDQRYPRA